MDNLTLGWKWILIPLTMLILKSAWAGERGLHAAIGVMALTNSTQQGGQGSQGSTFLTQTELTYHFSGPSTGWGLGVFAQYDRQGSNETDLTIGPKLELFTGPIYIEGGYAPLLKRTFTDRSISEQTGSAWVFGLGARFMLGGLAGGSGSGPTGVFLQFTYKYRIQSIKKQDGTSLSEAITQTDGYPLFGIGYLF